MDNLEAKSPTNPPLLRFDLNVVAESRGSELKLIVSVPEELVFSAHALLMDGWCPICQNEQINQGEPCCCECAERVIRYHVSHCGCVQASLVVRDSG